MKLDIYQAVTDRILELMEQGTVPWRRPIKGNGGDGFPKNLTSGKQYRGVNVFLLAAMSWIKGYESSYWLTYKQAQQLEGHVKKGEKSSLVIFWKRLSVEDKETSEKRIMPIIRHFNVFNADQCEGIMPPDRLPPDENAEPFEPIAAAEKIVSDYQSPPEIEHGGRQAYYLPQEDKIKIAAAQDFHSREGYYATLFHELAHSTGHTKRLNRGIDEKLSIFGSADYSREELVAELGAAFLSATSGISPPTIEQSAAYLAGWSKQLQDDKKLIVVASGAAQRAADHILGVTFGDEPQNAAEPSPAK